MPVPPRPYASHRLFADGLELWRGIDLAAEQGYAFVTRGISDRGRLDLESEMAGLPEPACFAAFDTAVPMATFASGALVGRLKEHRFRYPQLRDWCPGQVAYKSCQGPTDYILPSQDRRKDQPLEAVITIAGQSAVNIYEPTGDPDDYTCLRKIDEYRTRPGSMMILRAVGLTDGVTVTPRGVTEPKNGPHLTLNLRMRPDIQPRPSGLA